MAAPSLDHEFMQYWLRLSSVQKESLLSVAKNYLDLNVETGRISLEQYNSEIEEAMKRIDGGEFYTQEQMMAMSKSWTDAQ